MTSGGATVLMMLRVIVSLGLILGLCWGATWALKRRGTGRIGFRNADQLEIVERRSLSKGAAVAIVRVGGEDFLIGVTDHNVALLERTGATASAATGATVGRDTDTDEDVAQEGSTSTVDLTDGALRTVVPPAGPPTVRAAFKGTRWTGTQNPSADADGPTRMGFVEALREMTVRRS